MENSPSKETKKSNINITYNNNLNNIKDEDYNKIELLPLFSKISLSQALLKEMISKKELFEENKNKMIEKIKSNNFKYFKYVILSKEIYDNCKLKKDIKERKFYSLSSNPSKTVKKSIFPAVSDFLFFIRNNNKYMLHILNGTHNKYIKEVSYFLTHLFYENTINNNISFISKELQLIIYFQLENIINKSADEILLYNKDTFLFRLLEALIRKPRIKNFLNGVLKDLIIELNKKEKNFNINEDQNNNNSSNKSKKRVLAIIGKLKTESNFGRQKTLANSVLINNNKNNKLLSNKKINNKKLLKEKNTDYDSYNEFSDIDSKFIFDRLTNLKKNDNIEIAMNYIYGHHFSKVASSNNTYNYIVDEILEKEDENINNKNDYTKKIKEKYETVKYFINKLLEKIEQNIYNLPKSILYIINISSVLIGKKWNKKEKMQKIEFLKSMSKLKILIGNLILPMIKYISSKKIFGDITISDSTCEILKTIKKIFDTIIVGKIFDKNNEPEYTIYNRYIIEIFPKFMKIVSITESVGDGLNNGNYIFKKLINSFENNIDYDKRKINYDELIEQDKDEEKIKLQSICFNMEIAYILLKSVEKDKTIYINEENNEETNKIFENMLKIDKDLFVLFKRSQGKEYFLINKMIYKKEFEDNIKAIIQQNFEILLNFEKNNQITIFKKCLSELLGNIGILNKENFLPFIRPKDNIELNSTKQIQSFFNYKKNLIYSNQKFETQVFSRTISIDENANQNKVKKLALRYSNTLKQSSRHSISIKDKDKFFMKRKSIILPFFEIDDNENKKDELNFESLLEQILSKIKIEFYSFNDEKPHRINFSLSYVLSHYKELPIDYQKNNYSKLFIEIIRDTKNIIVELQNNLLNEFYMKIRYSEKINEIINKDFAQMKILEKLFYIKYLYQNLKVPGFIEKEANPNGKIIKIIFEPFQNQIKEGCLDDINSFIAKMPNFENEFYIENNKDILINEKDTGFVDTINNYFQEMQKIINKEKILTNLTNEEFSNVIHGLESFILKKLYQKIYPSLPNSEDIFLQKKCSKLSFLKPSNIIKDKKFINIKEKSLEISVQYIKEMENQKSPMDILDLFGKANGFLLNSMEFNSAKSDFGIDDLLPLQIYIIIKAAPKMLNSNYNFCMMYLNKDLMKKQFGNLMTQLGMIMKIIKNMKYTDLNNVTENEFGKDENV